MPQKKTNRRRYGSYYWIDPKTRLGYAKVRIPTDEKTASGKTKYKILTKRAKNQTDAEDIALEMLAEHSTRGAAFVEGYQMTFNELSNWYKQTHSVPPVYSEDGTKVSGMRTYKIEQNRIDAMQKFFGTLPIKNIDEEILHRYKRKREKEAVTSATINRDFEILRAMFRKAIRRKWLRESPFDFGDNLIEKALEKKRDVILSEDEEFALLHYAKKADKSVLYYVILCLLDTGARPSEIYDASTIKAEPVTWKSFFDYNFQAVQLVSLKGRQRIVRYAPVTKRLESAMLELWNSLKVDEQILTAQIFPVTTFKKSYGTARKNAGIALKIAKKLKQPVQTVLSADFPEDQFMELAKEFKNDPDVLNIRMRDMRRHLSTRLAKLGMENDQRQRILGHQKAQTTFDYTTADLNTAIVAKNLLDGKTPEQNLISEANN